MPPKVPPRKHRRYRSFINNGVRHVRVNSKLAFYEKFQATNSKDGKGVASHLPKRNFKIKRKKKTVDQLKDPMRARCPFYARALYDFEAEIKSEEISLKKDDLLCVTIVSPSKWCLSQNERGEEGWIPINYIERIHPKLDAKAAARAAECELKGVQARLSKAKLQLSDAERSGDKEAIRKAQKLVKDLEKRLDVAGRRVKAYTNMSEAVSNQELARQRLQQLKKDKGSSEAVEKAERWLKDAEDSVKEALEVLSNEEGLSAAMAAVQRAEAAAAAAVKAAEEASGSSNPEEVKQAKARLDRAKDILLTLKKYEAALVERQQATQIIMKSHHEGKEGLMEFKVAVAKKEEANARAKILKAAAECAFEQMIAEEECTKLRERIKLLKVKLEETRDPERRRALLVEINEAEEDLKAAFKKAEVSRALRKALEAQADALLEVQKVVSNEEVAPEVAAKAKAALETAVEQTKKASAEYKLVFGKEPLKEGGADIGNALAKLESLVVTEVAEGAPERNGEYAFGHNHQLILDAVQGTSIFDNIRREKEMEVYIGDLELVLAAAGRDGHTGAAIVTHLGNLNIRVASFEALSKMVEETLVQWNESKQSVKAYVKVEKQWDITNEELNLIFNRSLAGVDCLKYLKENPGSWGSDTASTIEYLIGCVAESRKSVEDTKTKCMGLVQKLLAGNTYSVHMSLFNALFEQNIPAKDILARLQKLKDAARKFSSLEAVADAILGRNANYSKRIERTTSDMQQNNVKNRVLKFITSPNCLLFESATLRVQASVMKKLNESYTEPRNVTLDLALAQGSHLTFTTFHGLATALCEEAVSDAREDAKAKVRAIPAFSSEDPLVVLWALADIAPHRLEECLRLAPLLPLKSGNCADAVQQLKGKIQELASKESKEIQAAIAFLSSELIFSSKTTIRKPQLTRLVRASLFNQYGLDGQSVGTLLTKFKTGDVEFSSFGDLLSEVIKAAARAPEAKQ